MVRDPHGLIGFALVAGAFLGHVLVVSHRRPYLVSEHLLLEVAAHLCLFLAPPLGAYLGVCHILRRGDSLLPLLTVPLGTFLTLLTVASMGVALGS